MNVLAEIPYDVIKKISKPWIHPTKRTIHFSPYVIGIESGGEPSGVVNFTPEDMEKLTECNNLYKNLVAKEKLWEENKTHPKSCGQTKENTCLPNGTV